MPMVGGPGSASVPTVNTSAAELPPAGAGFCNRTLWVPAVVSNAAGIVAVKVPDDTQIVVRGVAPKCTIAPSIKCAPVSVSKVAPAPTVTCMGVIAVSVAGGLLNCTIANSFLSELTTSNLLNRLLIARPVGLSIRLKLSVVEFVLRSMSETVSSSLLATTAICVSV